ncbi:MAG: ABC transporter permease [Candidatus Nitrosotenuis sp.]|nr:MAG: ABC transporter permease [Candidatus Nitrosotenuis sp.]
MTFRRIKPVVIKEFRQVRRDWVSLMLLILIPAFLMLMVGKALNFDVKNVKLAVFDQDKSSQSRDFIRAFTNSGYFSVVADVSGYPEIEKNVDSDKALAALVIPADFAKRLDRGDDIPVQILIDGSNSNTATTALGYMNTIIQTYSANLRAEFMTRRGQRFDPPVDSRPKVWYNPNLSSTKFLVPGFIGFILMLASVISTALSIVREKESGTMEQLTVSPLQTFEIVIGKTLPYFIISLASSALVLGIAFVFFDIAVRGSIIWLYLGIVIFLFAALGQGLLISAIAEKQQIAFLIAVLSSILPTFLLSGLVFPIRSMPWLLQIISNVTPVKFFLIVLRGVMLKGTGPGVFWRELLYMLLFAVVTLALAARIMLKKRQAA